MSLRFIPAAALVLLTAGAARAQSYTPARGALPGLRGSALTGSVSVGTAFAGRYGSASYLSPTLNYQLSKRLQVFAGGLYLRTFTGAVALPTDNGLALTPNYRGYNRYFVQGGGTYALSPRLSLTGTAWKDLTPLTAEGTRLNPYAAGNLGQGVNLRASYHISENVSISGGVGVSRGTAAPTYGLLGAPLGF
jgi:hypothetical protein